MWSCSMKARYATQKLDFGDWPIFFTQCVAERNQADDACDHFLAHYAVSKNTVATRVEDHVTTPHIV